MDDELKWYVATRKDSKAHVVINGNYMEKYEREFERIREFDNADEACEAYNVRCMVDKELDAKTKKKGSIAAGKVRGDIRKGSIEDEKLRSTLKEELRIELMKEIETGKATAGPKTRARTVRSKAKDKE